MYASAALHRNHLHSSETFKFAVEIQCDETRFLRGAAESAQHVSQSVRQE